MWAWVSLTGCIHWQLKTSQVAELVQKDLYFQTRGQASGETAWFPFWLGKCEVETARGDCQSIRLVLGASVPSWSLERCGWVCKKSTGITTCHAKCKVVVEQLPCEPQEAAYSLLCVKPRFWFQKKKKKKYKYIFISLLISSSREKNKWGQTESFKSFRYLLSKLFCFICKAFCFGALVAWSLCFAASTLTQSRPTCMGPRGAQEIRRLCCSRKQKSQKVLPKGSPSSDWAPGIYHTSVIYPRVGPASWDMAGQWARSEASYILPTTE